MQRFRFRLLIACAVSALSLAACGDDDNDNNDADATADVADGGGGDAGMEDSGGTDAGGTDTGGTDTGGTDTGGTDTGTPDADAGGDTADTGETPAFELQILHVGDPEAGADAIADGPRFVAIVNKLREAHPDNTITLSSGDNWIPGAFYTAGGDDALNDVIGLAASGRPDIALLNAAGVQAACFGNHEFDQGPGAVADIIAPASADLDEDGEDDAFWAGAAFPYLSANLDFSTSEDLSGLVADDAQAWDAVAGRIARSTVVEVAGESIGVVGATTPILGSISSPGDVGVLPEDATDLNALAALIQAEVDELTATGIDKIILLAHMQQISVEESLAPLLAGVDVIIAGGSNTILADDNDVLRPGDTAGGVYPIETAGSDDAPTLIVNTDGNLRYVGRLVLGFDENGQLLPGSLDPAINGAYATDDTGLAAVEATVDDAVAAITDAVSSVLVERDGNTFGWTNVYLDGRRGSVRTEETNMGNLSADATLWYAQQEDPTVAVVLRNGGGIRAPMGIETYPAGSTNPEDLVYLPPAANALAGKEEGEISQFDIENTLRFDNGIGLLNVTAAELLALVEHGVAASGDGATPGRFPQVAGMRFSFDVTATAGDRVQSLAIVDAAGAVVDTIASGGELQGDADRVIRVATLTFLAGGGDDYPFPALDGVGIDYVDLTEAGLEAGTVDTFDAGGEQDALAEYLDAFHGTMAMAYDVEEADPADDERIQDLAVRADTVLGAE